MASEMMDTFRRGGFLWRAGGDGSFQEGCGGEGLFSGMWDFFYPFRLFLADRKSRVEEDRKERGRREGG